MPSPSPSPSRSPQKPHPPPLTIPPILPLPAQLPSRPPSRPPSTALTLSSPLPSALVTPSTSAPRSSNALQLDLTPPGITPPGTTPTPGEEEPEPEPEQPRVHFRPRVHIGGATGRYRFFPSTATNAASSSVAGPIWAAYEPAAASGTTSVSSSFSVPLRAEPREGEGKAAGGWFRAAGLSLGNGRSRGRGRRRGSFGIPAGGGGGGVGERRPLLADSPVDDVGGRWEDGVAENANGNGNGKGTGLKFARRVVPLAPDRPAPTGKNASYVPPPSHSSSPYPPSPYPDSYGSTDGGPFSSFPYPYSTSPSSAPPALGNSTSPPKPKPFPSRQGREQPLPETEAAWSAPEEYAECPGCCVPFMSWVRGWGCCSAEVGEVGFVGNRESP